MVHDRAAISLLASEATAAFLYMDHAKSHSFTPPPAIALQYTVDLKLGLMLEGWTKMGKSYGSESNGRKSVGYNKTNPALVERRV